MEKKPLEIPVAIPLKKGILGRPPTFPREITIFFRRNISRFIWNSSFSRRSNLFQSFCVSLLSSIDGNYCSTNIIRFLGNLGIEGKSLCDLVILQTWTFIILLTFSQFCKFIKLCNFVNFSNFANTLYFYNFVNFASFEIL